MVRMWVQLKRMMCIVYASVAKGQSGDGCDLTVSLCK